MTESAIKVENLYKIYRLYDKPTDRLKEALNITKQRYHRDHFALNNISFEVNKGETVGIIGTNGSGKSTLLKIITGVLSATSGEVGVIGKISALLELGAGFNPEFTGIENIFLNGTMMGYSKKEINDKFPNIIDFADIGEFINQPVKTYSSGMFARLAFAVSINVEPDILIVDEALSVGDVFFQNKCFKKFEELQNLGTTILFVSHDISSIKQMCSRVLWLDNGMQRAFDDKDSVCSLFLNEKIKNMNDLNKHDNITGKNILIGGYTNQKREYPALVVSKENRSSEKAEILSFFITDGKDKIVEELFVLNHYSIHVVIRCKTDLDNVIVGFTMESNKGIALLGLNTFIASQEHIVSGKKGDIIECIFSIELPKIAKGEYIFSSAIAQGEQKSHVNLVWAYNCYKVIINNEGYNLSLIELENDLNIKKYKESNVTIIR